MATRPGFEPGPSAPKADVLPLHHRAMRSPGTAIQGEAHYYSPAAASVRQVSPPWLPGEN